METTGSTRALHGAQADQEFQLRRGKRSTTRRTGLVFGLATLEEIRLTVACEIDLTFRRELSVSHGTSTRA